VKIDSRKIEGYLAITPGKAILISFFLLWLDVVSMLLLVEPYRANISIICRIGVLGLMTYVMIASRPNNRKS